MLNQAESERQTNSRCPELARSCPGRQRGPSVSPSGTNVPSDASTSADGVQRVSPRRVGDAPASRLWDQMGPLDDGSAIIVLDWIGEGCISKIDSGAELSVAGTMTGELRLVPPNPPYEHWVLR